jgi:hypothetical protein
VSYSVEQPPYCDLLRLSPRSEDSLFYFFLSPLIGGNPPNLVVVVVVVVVVVLGVNREKIRTVLVAQVVIGLSSSSNSSTSS